eukprot:gene9357-11491_t
MNNTSNNAFDNRNNKVYPLTISYHDTIQCIEYQNGCRRIILTRESSLNSLTMEMIITLKKILKDYQSKSDVKLVILSSSSRKAYCAGGDLKEFLTLQQDEKGAKKFTHTEYSLDYLIHTYPKPIISIVDGIAMGGGVGISYNCEYRVVTENSVWAMPECKIGYFPDVGTSFMLSRLGSIGLYLGLTGEKITTKDMMLCRIGTHYIPRDLIDRLIVLPHDQIGSVIEKNKESIDRCFKLDLDIIEILKKVEDEKPVNPQWSEKTLKVLKSNCPTSMGVYLELLRRAISMDIEDSITLEGRLALRLIKRNDLKEGVESTLIHKNRTPNWNPTLNQLTIAHIMEMFDPFDNPSLEINLYE